MKISPFPNPQYNYTNKIGISMPDNRGIAQALTKSDSFSKELINPYTPVAETKNRGEVVSAFVKENIKPEDKNVLDELTSNDGDLTFQIGDTQSVEIYA